MIAIRSIVTLSLPQDFFSVGAGRLNELGLDSPPALTGARVVASDGLSVSLAPLLLRQAPPRWMARVPGRSPLRFIGVCCSAHFVGGAQVLCVALDPCALRGQHPLVALRGRQAWAAAAAGDFTGHFAWRGVPRKARRAADTLYMACDFFSAHTDKGTRVSLQPRLRAVEGIAPALPRFYDL
jgi:hypothetical protein